MHKLKAIELLGGSIASTAEAIGITYQAVNQWPDELPPRIADRVQAAVARISQVVETQNDDTTPNRRDPDQPRERRNPDVPDRRVSARSMAERQALADAGKAA